MANSTYGPHNVEAEQAFLGAIIIDPGAIFRVVSLVYPADFYVERHSCIYQAILDLYEARTPIDFVILCDRLRTAGALSEIGGIAYLARLMRLTPTSVHAEYYAKIVHKYAKLRRVIAAAGRLARLAHMVEDPDKLLARIETVLLDLLQKLKD